MEEAKTLGNPMKDKTNKTLAFENVVKVLILAPGTTAKQGRTITDFCRIHAYS